MGDKEQAASIWQVLSPVFSALLWAYLLHRYGKMAAWRREKALSRREALEQGDLLVATVEFVRENAAFVIGVSVASVAISALRDVAPAPPEHPLSWFSSTGLLRIWSGSLFFTILQICVSGVFYVWTCTDISIGNALRRVRRRAGAIGLWAVLVGTTTLATSALTTYLLWGESADVVKPVGWLGLMLLATASIMLWPAWFALATGLGVRPVSVAKCLNLARGRVPKLVGLMILTRCLVPFAPSDLRFLNQVLTAAVDILWILFPAAYGAQMWAAEPLPEPDDAQISAQGTNG